MNDKYFIGRSEKQIENITNELIQLRQERKDIDNKINNLLSIKELLKKGIKKNNQEISSKAFKDGWDKCRAWMCKLYKLNESDVIENEQRDY